MDGIIAGMGEVLWDILPEGKKLGGAPANFAYHIAQFGFESTVLSAVGTDALGDVALAILRGKGLAGEIERVAYPTGTVRVTLDEAGIRRSATASQAIGYKEVLAALGGLCTLDEAREQVKRSTRRYAKRQLSWIRRDGRATVVPMGETTVEGAAALVTDDLRRSVEAGR